MSVDRVRGTAGGPPRFRARVMTPLGRRSVGIYDTREEAEAVAAAAVARLRIDYPNGVSLLEYLDGWLEGRTCASADDERGIAARYIETDSIGSIPVASLRSSHVDEWVRRLLLRVSIGTTRTAFGLLRRAMHSAVRDGRTKANPCVGIKLPKQRRTSPPWTFLHPAEQVALVDAARRELGDDEADLIAFAIGTGLRAGELSALHKVDVDPDAGSVTVRFGARGVPTKSGQPRTVALFGMALEAARRAIARRSRPNPHRLLFPALRGGYRSPKHVLSWANWKRVVAEASITRRLRWHDLRHTCATSLVCAWWGRRWTIQEVCAQLGHSSIALTMRYAHLADETLLDAGRQTGGGSSGTSGGGHTLPTEHKSASSKNEVITKGTPGWTRTSDHRLRRRGEQPAITTGSESFGQTLGELAATCADVLRFVADHGVAPTARVIEICESVVRLATQAGDMPTASGTK